MTALQDYIKTSAERDGDLSWKWRDNGAEVRMIGFDEADEYIERLKSDHPNITLLPVDDYYRSDEQRVKKAKGYLPAETFPPNKADEISKQHHIPLNRSIRKLYPTGASEIHTAIKSPSIFISPESGGDKIKPGDEFILVDDSRHSGGTLRDLVRHINNRGGKVLGVVLSTVHEEQIDYHELHLRYYSNDYKLDGLYEKLWQLESKDAQTPKPFEQLPAAEQKAFIHKAMQQADRHLQHCGLTLNQLTDRELTGLVAHNKERHYSSADDFWNRQLDGLAYDATPHLDKIHDVKALSQTLGTELDGNWTGTPRGSRTTQTAAR